MQTFRAKQSVSSHNYVNQRTVFVKRVRAIFFNKYRGMCFQRYSDCAQICAWERSSLDY